jgi:hypothetical protein
VEQHYHHVEEDQRDGACSTHCTLLCSANLKERNHLEDASANGGVTTQRIVIKYWRACVKAVMNISFP